VDRRFKFFDSRSGYEHAVVGGVLKNLVGVHLRALSASGKGTTFFLKVERWIHEIVGVWEKEFHTI
jgi:hypothetical protein